jgi:hypothetical protein
MPAHNALALSTGSVSGLCLPEVKAGRLPVKIFVVDGAGVFAFARSAKVHAFFPGRLEYSIPLYYAQGRVPHNNGAIVNAALSATKTYHFDRSFSYRPGEYNKQAGKLFARLTRFPGCNIN